MLALPPPNRLLDLLALGETMALVVPARPEPLEEAEDFRVAIGGAESNVACHLAATGHRTAWLSALGEDALGRRVRGEIASHGVDVSAVRLDPAAPTGLYVKDPGHGVTYYRAGSAASRLGPADLERVDLARARIVHLTGITLALSASCRDLVHAAIEATHATGALVSLDVNYRPALWDTTEEAACEILTAAREADVVLVGRDEAETLWGTATADEIRALLPDVPRLVVKDAEIEAVEFTGGARTAVPTPRVEVIEAVGAGDAFAAGWFDGLLHGVAADERLARGHARAAHALSSTQDIPTPTGGPRS
ncbi:sugar kinase [Brachybacterium conglomeratum]|uniref:sugar kinase n=1 Tax=Brachybacterium conglomeratum TaxID=47846 RepID=UPI003DA15B9C